MSHDPNWGFLPIPYAHYGGLPTPTYAQCPGCGLFGTEIVGSTSVGCPMCYDVFTQVVGLTIWEQQGCTSHQGKTPRSEQMEMRIATYKEAIARAQAEGRQEDAQVFTDMLGLLQADSR